MLTKICFGFALLVALPAWSQVDSPVESAPIATDDQMATPPPVSGVAFPTAVGAEERSNYIRGGIDFQTAYIDNMYGGAVGNAIGETTYSILPSITFDQTTPRQHRLVSYSPGFMFYRPTSTLNQVNQNAALEYQLRLTPHSSININDIFQDSSTGFLSSNSGAGSTVTGSAQSVIPQIVPPFAQELSNRVNAEFSVQTGRNTMIGVSGMATLLRYPNPAETSGLYDSSSRGGAVFYNHRVSESQYAGATYEYSQFLTYPTNATSETQTHTISAFYTLYLKRRLSLSISGGPQYYLVTQAPLPSSSAWQPSVMASIGWQGRHTSFAASYLREVTGGGGLLGAYKTSSVATSARWQIARNWTAGANGAYSNYSNVSPLLFTANSGGHSTSGSAILEHALVGQLQVGLEYDRMHNSYGGVTSLSNNPNSDRISGSVTWQFMRVLGQ